MPSDNFCRFARLSRCSQIGAERVGLPQGVPSLPASGSPARAGVRPPGTCCAAWFRPSWLGRGGWLRRRWQRLKPVRYSQGARQGSVLLRRGVNMVTPLLFFRFWCFCEREGGCIGRRGKTLPVVFGRVHSLNRGGFLFVLWKRGGLVAGWPGHRNSPLGGNFEKSKGVPGVTYSVTIFISIFPRDCKKYAFTQI